MARTADAGASNPFSLPPEQEFFWLSRPDQHAETERSRSQARDQRVWEKSTAASRCNSIARLRDEDLPMAPLPKALQDELDTAKVKAMAEERPDATFLTTVATGNAVGLAGPLAQKNTEGKRDAQAKETNIGTYVLKKREVFLAHMSCDVKKAEIQKLEEKAKMKEEALAKSQQMLDADSKKFNDFFRERHARQQQTNKEAEAEVKRKVQKQQEIRLIKGQIDAVQREIAKLKEVREECSRYKGFLMKLTPAEWKEEQAQLKLARKQQRRERWVTLQMAPIHQALAEEEEKIERAFATDEEAESKYRRRGKQKRKEDEEQEQQRERERQARRKRLQKRRDDEERRVAAEYEEVSSEEEYELHFKEPQQLMDTFIELEEKNLFLIQSSQETEQMLDELQHTFDRTKREMGGKVQQLKESIRQLEASIAQEKRRGEELRLRYAEKAGTQAQDKKLADLAQKVHEVYVHCGLSADQGPDPLQMLAHIESKIEELIQGLDEAYHEDSEVVMRLEWEKERKRRERLKQHYFKEKNETLERRLTTSLARTQKPVFKKAGKQVMFRSPPLRMKQREVQDTTDDEANARDHRVFGVYIDRRTQLPRTEAPEAEEPRRGPPSLLPATPGSTSLLPTSPG